jgi:hypothetical protein
MHLDPAHQALLSQRLPWHELSQYRAAVSCLPWLRVPCYLFIGQTAA